MSYIGNTLPANFQSLPAVQRFNGDGSDTTFTLAAQIANDQSILVSVDGVTQDSNAYSVSGTTLTFTAAPSSGTGNIFVHTISPVGSTVVPPDGIAINATTGTFTDGLTVDDDGTTPLIVDRASSDGTIIEIHKDGSVKGKIGNLGNDPYIGRNAGVGLTFQNNKIRPADGDDGSGYDNAVDLGEPTYRFKDLYLSSGVFLGGTGSANELDDYEEGTWTPTDASGASMTLTVYVALYTKIGRKVFIEFGGAFPSNSSTADLTIGGLPFTSISGGDNTGGFALVGTNSGRSDLWLVNRGQSSLSASTNGNVSAKNNNYSDKQLKLCGSYTTA